MYEYTNKTKKFKVNNKLSDVFIKTHRFFNVLGNITFKINELYNKFIYGHKLLL